MKKTVLTLVILLASQAFARGGSDVGNAGGGFADFPFQTNKQQRQGYMLTPSTAGCRIIKGDKLFAGNPQLNRPALDLVKATALGDSQGGFGVMMALSSNETVAFMGALMSSQGDQSKFSYQAPDKFHDFNHVDYVVDKAANNSLDIKITMTTAAGKTGTAEINCAE
jgi:hypothetical protein